MLPKLTASFPALLGEDQSQSTLLLSSLYSPGGSKNLYIDKRGRIRSVGGWAKQAVNAKTTDTGGSAAMWRALYAYRKIAGGSTTRQLLGFLDDQVNEAELHYSTDQGATWTLIADLGATAVGLIPSFATFGDLGLIAVGPGITARTWDGTTLGTAGSTQLGAPTVVDAGTGLLNGKYKYRVVPVLNTGALKPGSVASALIDLQNRRTDLSWTADADTNVIGYFIYRTSGTGEDLYEVTYVEGRTTATYSNETMADADLILRRVLEEHGDPPPTGVQFVEVHKQRAWWGKTATFPRREWFSTPGDPDSIYTDRNYIDYTDAESLGDEMTGSVGEFNGLKVAFLERSIWTVSGTGTIINNTYDWNRRRTDAQTGTVSGRTVVRVPKGAKWTDQDGQVRETARATLGFLTPEKDIRLFDGTADAIISFAKKETLARLNYQYSRKAFAYDDHEHGMFVWVFPADSATEPSYSVAWNYWYGTWHEWDGTTFGHVERVDTATATQMLIAGEANVATGAFLYQLWSGSSRAGVAITSTWLSKPIYPTPADMPTDLTRWRRFRDLVALFEKDATPETVTWELLAHDAADSATAETGYTGTMDGTSRQRTRLVNSEGRYYHGPGARLRLTVTTDDGPWILNGLDLQYQILMGQVR